MNIKLDILTIHDGDGVTDIILGTGIGILHMLKKHEVWESFLEELFDNNIEEPKTVEELCELDLSLKFKLFKEVQYRYDNTEAKKKSS